MTTFNRKTSVLAALGIGLLAIPLALSPATASTAQADDLRVSFNLGAPAYVQPERVVYRTYQPAPERVVYVPQPQRVVYVSRPAYAPIYRERIVYRDSWHNRHDHARYERWDGRGDRVAWR